MIKKKSKVKKKIVERKFSVFLQKKKEILHIFLHIIFIIYLTASFTPEDSLQKLHFVLLAKERKGKKVRI